MNPLRVIFGIVVSAIVIGVGCQAAGDHKLDMGEYLSHAKEGVVYPTEKQKDMLRPFMAAEAYQPVPSIADRQFWSGVAEKESAQKIFEEAVSDLEKKPEVPITDEIYRRANKEGNRGIYKPRYYRTM
tara:strand:+ start:681 stop:1064 length:384 start_codon:yes stop_codon:yes gene_type:complete